MAGTERVSLILRRLLLGTLVVVVVVFVAVQVDKYAKFQTTIAKTRIVEKEMLLPAISFCPGLNHIVSSGFDWLNSEWHGRAGEGIDLTTFPNGEEAAEELWEKINFSLDKVVVSLFGYTGNDLTESYSTGEEIIGDCLETRPLDTLGGRCFSVAVTCPKNEKYSLFLKFNHSLLPFDDLAVTLHHQDPVAALGLNLNYWSTPALSLETKLGRVLDVELSKHSLQRDNGVSDLEYFSCLGSRVAEMETRLKAKGVCYFPFFKSLLDHMPSGPDSFPPCSNATQYITSRWTMFDVLVAFKRADGCLKPRSEPYFTAQIRTQSTVISPGTSQLMFFLEGGMEASVEEEYVLMDFGALLAAVGGFVGMLLGWSAKDLVEIVPGGRKKTAPEDDR